MADLLLGPLEVLLIVGLLEFRFATLGLRVDRILKAVHIITKCS